MRQGTYIRVLGEDISRKLGTLGHLTRLCRTWVEPFRDVPMVFARSGDGRCAMAGRACYPRMRRWGGFLRGVVEASQAAGRQGQAV